MPHHATITLTPEESDLLNWFGALTPGQRLDELQSRVDFLRVFRADDDQQLPATDRNTEPARG
ncbi:MAG: hypothetical protein WCY72_03980 [Lysobacteraceae bacterium]